jgi:hypothetical protein
VIVCIKRTEQWSQTWRIVEGKSTKRTKEWGMFSNHELITNYISHRSFASNLKEYMPLELLMLNTAHSSKKQFLAYIGKTIKAFKVLLTDY